MFHRDDDGSFHLAVLPGRRSGRVCDFGTDEAESRYDKLARRLAPIMPAFAELSRLIRRYMTECPQAVSDTPASDDLRMVQWLEKSQTLSVEQRDYLACQHVRHSLEAMARRNRVEHFAFQERSKQVETFLPVLDSHRSVRLFLNPIRAWQRLYSRVLLGDHATTPADVLFFISGGEIATAFFELEGKALLNDLADHQPCGLAEWVSHSACAAHFDLEDFARDLAELGIVAFE